MRADGPVNAVVHRRAFVRAILFFAVLTLSASSAFALYDPAPEAALAAVQGKWNGQLTYRDYSKPDRLVTLPTRMFVALGGPSELVLHLVFDDGPTKKVFSYERMAFDFAARQVAWTSGSARKTQETYAISQNMTQGDATVLKFERQHEGKTHQYTLSLSPARFVLTKEEVQPSGEATFRNRYEFARDGV